MKIIIETDTDQLSIESDGKVEKCGLYSDKAFEIISKWWLKVGWNQKYPYTFSWLGRPIIQNPEDMVRIQEVIYEVEPDVIVETGVAHGGSLIFYSSLCRAMGKGRVIGIDIEIRPHNRKAIEEHELSSYITLVEGSSISNNIVQQVAEQIKDEEKVLVILDSNHTYEHVIAELEVYSPLVSKGSYIVATDGSMEVLYDVPRGKMEWKNNNPAAAARDFAKRHDEFELVQPDWNFNESTLKNNITHWPDAWLRRK